MMKRFENPDVERWADYRPGKAPIAHMKDGSVWSMMGQLKDFEVCPRCYRQKHDGKCAPGNYLTDPFQSLPSAVAI